VEAIDWATQVDEWEHHACVSLEEGGRASVAGRRYDATTHPFNEIIVSSFDDCPTASRFLYAPLDEGGVLVAVGVPLGDDIDDQVITEWARASTEATRRLGAVTVTYEWTALLAPPVERVARDHPALRQPASLGPFRLNPCDHSLREYLPSERASLISANVGVSWPIVVSGEHQGYGWPAAMKASAFELHRLAGLLSVLVDDCIVLRDAPIQTAYGHRVIPDRLRWQQEMPKYAEIPIEPSATYVLPEWAEEAWQRLSTDARAASALGAYHEGLQLQFRHPSIALVMFLAAVESLAVRMSKTNHCAVCAGLKNSAERRRHAIDVVSSNPDVAQRLDETYGPRSQTVHAGKLHGPELSLGSFGFFWNDVTRDFERDVWAMRRVARELLRLVLTDGRVLEIVGEM
jgi:hypothetical protein